MRGGEPVAARRPGGPGQGSFRQCSGRIPAEKLRSQLIRMPPLAETYGVVGSLDRVHVRMSVQLGGVTALILPGAVLMLLSDEARGAGPTGPALSRGIERIGISRLGMPSALRRRSCPG